PISPSLSPSTTTAAKRKLRRAITTLATRLMVTTRSSNSVLFVSLFLAHVTFPSFYIKIQVQIHELLLLMLSHVHGIHIHRGQKRLVYSLFQLRVLLM